MLTKVLSIKKATWKHDAWNRRYSRHQGYKEQLHDAIVPPSHGILMGRCLKKSSVQYLDFNIWHRVGKIAFPESQGCCFFNWKKNDFSSEGSEDSNLIHYSDVNFALCLLKTKARSVFTYIHKCNNANRINCVFQSDAWRCFVLFSGYWNLAFRESLRRRLCSLKSHQGATFSTLFNFKEWFMEDHVGEGRKTLLAHINRS